MARSAIKASISYFIRFGDEWSEIWVFDRSRTLGDCRGHNVLLCGSAAWDEANE